MSILEHVFADTVGAKSSFVNSTINQLHDVCKFNYQSVA